MQDGILNFHIEPVNGMLNVRARIEERTYGTSRVSAYKLIEDALNIKEKRCLTRFSIQMVQRLQY